VIQLKEKFTRNRKPMLDHVTFLGAPCAYVSTNEGEDWEDIVKLSLRSFKGKAQIVNLSLAE
jgi:hypothetical protein